MAQPGVPTPSPVPSSGKKSNYLNFRVDDDLSDAVWKFAAEHGVSVSRACRLLLGMALGTPTTVAAAREAIAEFSAHEKRFVARLLARMQEVMPGILHDEFMQVHEDGEG